MAITTSSEVPNHTTDPGCDAECEYRATCEVCYVGVCGEHTEDLAGTGCTEGLHHTDCAAFCAECSDPNLI